MRGTVMVDNVEKELEKLRKHRKELDKKNNKLFIDLQASLQLAELKHPNFAYSFKEGVMRVMEELGEVAAAYNKMQGEVRVNEELMDTLVVVWRLARGDWKEAGNG